LICSQRRIVGRVPRRRKELLVVEQRLSRESDYAPIGDTKYDICCSVMLVAGDWFIYRIAANAAGNRHFSKTARPYLLKSGAPFAIVPSF